MSGPGENKLHGCFSLFFFPFFFLSFFSQEAEYRTSIRIKLWNILDPNPPYATVKNAVPSLPASQLQSCLCESAEQTVEHHTPCVTPLPNPWENNPAQPLNRLNPKPQDN
jgi:hypothetical protein